MLQCNKENIMQDVVQAPFKFIMRLKSVCPIGVTIKQIIPDDKLAIQHVEVDRLKLQQTNSILTLVRVSLIHFKKSIDTNDHQYVELIQTYRNSSTDVTMELLR